MNAWQMGALVSVAVLFFCAGFCFGIWVCQRLDAARKESRSYDEWEGARVALDRMYGQYWQDHGSS